MYRTSLKRCLLILAAITVCLCGCGKTPLDNISAIDILEASVGDNAFNEELASISDIVPYGRGDLFSSNYMDSKGCTRLFYVESKWGDSNIIKEVEGVYPDKSGITIMATALEGNTVIWGAVLSYVYDTTTSTYLDANYSELIVDYGDDTSEIISIENNTPFVIVAEGIKDVVSWSVLDSEGLLVQNDVYAEGAYGESLLYQMD